MAKVAKKTTKSTHLTPFNITQNKDYMDSRKEDASFFLNKFKWTKEQNDFLKEIQNKGYSIVPSVNKIRVLFGNSPFTTDKKAIVSIMANSKRKTSLVVFTIN